MPCSTWWNGRSTPTGWHGVKTTTSGRNPTGWRPGGRPYRRGDVSPSWAAPPPAPDYRLEGVGQSQQSPDGAGGDTVGEGDILGLDQIRAPLLLVGDLIGSRVDVL